MKPNAGGDNINPGVLSELVSIRMPFGKYQGRLLCDLPVTYLEWFSRKGFPRGRSAPNYPQFMKSSSTDWNIF